MPPCCFGKYSCSEGQTMTCHYADLCQIKEFSDQFQKTQEIII
jgi:hypothetical protein